MSRPHSVRNFTLAFLGGCLMTYLCMRLKSRLDSSRLSRKELGMSEQQPVDDVSLPASLGLSPMALSLQTGSATATPDRLIVAVRHAEVQAQQMFSTLSPPSQGLLSRQKARPIGMTARTTGPSCNALQPSKYEVSQCTLARMRISDAKCARWLQKKSGQGA